MHPSSISSGASLRVLRAVVIVLPLTDTAQNKFLISLFGPSALCLGREVSKHAASQQAMGKETLLAFSFKVIGMTIALQFLTE